MSNVEERNKGLEYAKPIHVGNKVWIGGSITVCPGVSIGDNRVIAATVVGQFQDIKGEQKKVPVYKCREAQSLQ